MLVQETKLIKIQLYHPIMGHQTFQVNLKDHFAELRTLIMENTTMVLFENFRFEYQGKKLIQFQDISQILQHDAKINLILQPFDQKSSLHHFQKVKQILAHPFDWALLNSKEPEDIRDPNIQVNFAQINLQNFMENPITSFLNLPMIQKTITTPFVEFIVFSSFNPVPYHRKIAGDFYYIYLRTLQGNDYHITANPKGYYINSSQTSHFNCQPASKKLFINILDLIRFVSQKFATNFDGFMNSFRVNQLDKMILTSIKSQPKCNWFSEMRQTKKNKAHLWRGCEPEKIKQTCTIKDWNQIIQMHSISNSDSILDRLNKEKYRYKLYQELIEFTKEGVVKIIDGGIPPVNPSAPLHSQIFLFGSLVFAFTEECPYHYKAPLTGAPTAKMMNCQLLNLSELDKIKLPELHLQHTVIVKYKGYSLIAQTIIPGKQLIRSEKSEVKSLPNSEKQTSIISNLCKILKLAQKLVFKNNEGKIERSVCNPELNIFEGSDKRKYITGLIKLSPRDLNFPGIQNQTCIIRPELIKHFAEKQKCKILINTMIENGYNLVMNETTKAEQLKLKSLAKFAKEIMLPLCLNSLKHENRKFLGDSKGVVEVMHRFGLSSRYLGLMYNRADKSQIPHAKIIIQRAILVKSLKNVFRMALREHEKEGVNNLLSHLLNCIFCKQSVLEGLNQSRSQEKEDVEVLISKKKKKKYEKQKEEKEEEIIIGVRSSKFSVIRPTELWEIIKKISEIRYGHKLKEQKISNLECFKSKYGRMAVLRDLAICLGLVLQKVQYFSKEELMFQPENILQINPLSKHIPIQNKHLLELIEEGDRMTEKCKVEEAIESYNKSIQFMMNNFGNLHDKLALVHKKISNIYFRIGQINTAILFAMNSCRMLEQIYGVSHIETLENYSLLSLYYFANRNLKLAEYYILKMIFIATNSYGQQYPQIIPGYLNLSTIYEAQQKFTDSIQCITKALELSLTIFGQFHINTAICYAALALLHFQIPDIDQSIKLQEKVYEILSKLLKSDEPRVKESKQILQYYRSLQMNKKIKEFHEKEKKKLMNSQLYGTLPLFKLPEPTNREREALGRKMQMYGNKSIPNYFF